ncbi:MAG: nitroreductase family deazaflavin-dependent oxidoreductase [Gemmatimonadales bacterium]|jgi:hypothetical protein|nr:nitroreductase family deazaflavin-dependent oxidoreductase [Gemmatimonadales bacterium]MBT3830329.1 nitroreductase family deazaflavin-dependent oxidoreductase [Gammaproteobacteria bacterium]MBT4914071.1 nitroreductase family deazaflavin-dependent oxidoreductase [Gemmatimonadales bacterium]MBT6374134.1 nitroreductase family deazaflavin-dependent oxidoreductase [Gemmatimonadales bacterium]|tara:strand:- start:108 stop:572 length:465 start_codon:yes stop_codon:yes gene_type:complete
MSAAEKIESLVYKIVNPFMKALLRSPLHGYASGSLTLLHFQGHKSGREFVTPLSYVRQENTVWLLSAHSTRWWMNLREDGTAVKLVLAGEMLNGKAKLWDGDSDALRDRVRRYITALPRDAKFYSIELDENEKPVEESLAKVAPELVFVEVELE